MNFLKHFAHLQAYIYEKHIINFKIIYHEFTIVYRCGYPHYRMGAWRICLLGSGADTCVISHCHYRHYSRTDQKANGHINIKF